MSNDPIHQLVTHDFDTRVVVAILGEVDQSNAKNIEHNLRIAADGKPLVIDLRSTAYFDSAGVAMLHSLRQQTELELLVEPESIVRRLLEITGVDQLVPMVRSSEDVAGAIQPPGHRGSSVRSPPSVLPGRRG